MLKIFSSIPSNHITNQFTPNASNVVYEGVLKSNASQSEADEVMTIETCSYWHSKLQVFRRNMHKRLSLSFCETWAGFSNRLTLNGLINWLGVDFSHMPCFFRLLQVAYHKQLSTCGSSLYNLCICQRKRFLICGKRYFFVADFNHAKNT